MILYALFTKIKGLKYRWIASQETTTLYLERERERVIVAFLPIN